MVWLIQIGLLLATVIIARFHGTIPHGPGICVSLIVAMALLGLFSHAMEEGRRNDTVRRAQEEWQRECRERMMFEMARGLSEPAAEFIVKPFMMARWPATYEAAIAYLSRRQQDPQIGPIRAAHVPPRQDVLPPAGPRQITDRRWEDGGTPLW